MWLYNARLLSTGHGKIEGIEAQCLDVKPDMFRTPLALANSKIGLSVMTYCHQLNGHHRGVTATYVESLSVFTSWAVENWPARSGQLVLIASFHSGGS